MGVAAAWSADRGRFGRACRVSPSSPPGHWTDRLTRRKPVMIAGYLSPRSHGLLRCATAAWHVLLARAAPGSDAACAHPCAKRCSLRRWTPATYAALSLRAHDGYVRAIVVRRQRFSCSTPWGTTTELFFGRWCRARGGGVCRVSRARTAAHAGLKHLVSRGAAPAACALPEVSVAVGSSARAISRTRCYPAGRPATHADSGVAERRARRSDSMWRITFLCRIRLHRRLARRSHEQAAIAGGGYALAAIMG